MAGNPMYPQGGYGQQGIGQQQMQGRQNEGQPTDYLARFNKLGKGGAFLKFEDNVGIEIVIASEAVDKEDMFENKKTGERKMIQKISFQVYAKDKNGIYDGQTLVTWDIPEGETQKSLYGKILYLIAANNGKATGMKLHVAKDSSGERPDYKVVEYDQLKSREMFEGGAPKQTPTPHPTAAQAPAQQQPQVAQPQAAPFPQVPKNNPAGLPPEAFR